MWLELRRINGATRLGRKYFLVSCGTNRGGSVDFLLHKYYVERDSYAQELISSWVIGVGGPSLDDNEAGSEADQWGNRLGR